jgi:hypothetical protein
MKKRLLLVVVILIALAACFACTPPRTKFNGYSDNDIDNFRNKLEQAQSCEMLMEMAANYQNINITMRYDGNKSYISAFASEPEQYREIVGNIVYTYTREGNSWKKESEYYDSESVGGSEEFIELFVGENYTYNEDEDAYYLNEDTDINLMSMEVKSMRLELGYNSCQLNGIFYMSGTNINFSLTIHEINNITIILPPINQSL